MVSFWWKFNRSEQKINKISRNYKNLLIPSGFHDFDSEFKGVMDVMLETTRGLLGKF